MNDDVRLSSLPTFRGLWLATGAGDAARMLALFATSVILTVTLGASAFEIGLVLPLSSAGALVFGLLAGALVDRWGPRRTLLGSAAVRLLAYAVPFLLWAGGVLTAWELLAAVFVASVADVFFSAGHDAVLPGLVGRARVSDAAGTLQATDQVIQLLGPSSGGVLLRWLPAPLLLAVAGVGQLVALLGLRRLPVDAQWPRHERLGLWRSIGEGIRYNVQTPLIGTLTLTSGINNFAAGIYTSVEAVFILRVLDFSPTAYGVLMSVSAVGGILGALAGARLGRALGPLRAIFVAACMMPVNFALMPVATLFPGAAFGLVALSWVLFSVSIGVYGVNGAGLRARLTPTRLLGRVSSARRVVTQGAIVIGGLLGAALSQAFGAVVPLWIAVGIAAVQLVPLVRSGVPRRGDATGQEVADALGEEAG